MMARLNRLAYSTRDPLNILDAIAKAGATFNSLADSRADTTTMHGRLMLTVWTAWQSSTVILPRVGHRPGRRVYTWVEHWQPSKADDESPLIW